MTFKPVLTPSFNNRTMCSRPLRGVCRAGGPAPVACSIISHWFHPAKMNSSPPTSKRRPFTRTKESADRHVVAATWSSSRFDISKLLCLPEFVLRNQSASWSADTTDANAKTSCSTSNIKLIVCIPPEGSRRMKHAGLSPRTLDYTWSHIIHRITHGVTSSPKILYSRNFDPHHGLLQLLEMT